MRKQKARGRRPDVMGGPQRGARDDETMGRPEPAETEADVMDGPGKPSEVMHRKGRPVWRRLGRRKATDAMGGPGRSSDVMSSQRDRPA
jgi:hypothetical protein